MTDVADGNETYPAPKVATEEEEDAATPTTANQPLVDCAPSTSKTSVSAKVVGSDLNQDVLLVIAKHMDVKTLKAARSVNKDWNAVFSKEFRKRANLVAEMTFEKGFNKFIEIFNPNLTLIPENVWFRKQKFLEHNSIMKWMEGCGAQIKSAKLGHPLDENDFRVGGATRLAKKAFSIKVISSFLDQCPNLKSLTLVAPYTTTSSQATFKLKPEANIELDYLEIGSQSNKRVYASTVRDLQRTPRCFYGSSSLLMNTLRCLKSLKALSIVNMVPINFDGISETLDERGKAVLANIMELSLEDIAMDPREFFSPTAPFLQFQNLRKLRIASFCGCNEASVCTYVHLADFLSSVSDQLEELILEQCSNKNKMKCPKLDKCFPPTTTMTKLEVFKILGITEWKTPSLEFLKQLPKLKVLHISKASSSSGFKTVDKLFRTRTTESTVWKHNNLKELVFRCGTKVASTFSGITKHFPKLETLEADFYGKDLEPVFTVLGKKAKVKNLKLFVYAEFECNYFDALSSSGIRKLSLEYPNRNFYSKLKVSLTTSGNLGLLRPNSLREFNFVGMKFVKDEYELLQEKLTKTKSKLKLRLFGCVLAPEDPPDSPLDSDDSQDVYPRCGYNCPCVLGSDDDDSEQY